MRIWCRMPKLSTGLHYADEGVGLRDQGVHSAQSLSQQGESNYFTEKRNSVDWR
jgi:hypothetical protein